MTANLLDGRHDFDFFMGRWTVAHRRLKKRLAGDTNWEEFPGTTITHPLMGDVGNFDENVIEFPAGRYEAMTLRLYDPAARHWSIYWVDARRGQIDPPVHGVFENGRGVFHGDDMFEGRKVRVRFLWSNIAENSCHWEQALSDDGGKTWETNWRMAFTRA